MWTHIALTEQKWCRFDNMEMSDFRQCPKTYERFSLLFYCSIQRRSWGGGGLYTHTCTVLVKMSHEAWVMTKEIDTTVVNHSWIVACCQCDAGLCASILSCAGPTSLNRDTPQEVYYLSPTVGVIHVPGTCKACSHLSQVVFTVSKHKCPQLLLTEHNVLKVRIWTENKTKVHVTLSLWPECGSLQLILKISE